MQREAEAKVERAGDAEGGGSKGGWSQDVFALSPVP
jgi:hypothetical protein